MAAVDDSHASAPTGAARSLHASGIDVVFLGCGIFIAATGWMIGLTVAPEPHSDWLYYWTAAGDPGRYERGGLGLWLLAAAKAIGLPPLHSALVLNTLATIACIVVAARLDPFRWRPFATVVLAYLAALTPYLSIVQLDLLSAGMVAAGLGLVPTTERGRSMRPAAAIVLVSVGVSTKPQYALVIWALLLLAIPILLQRSRKPFGCEQTLLVVLLAGSLCGFAADSALRKLAERSDSMRTVSAVTLYSGLLVSSAAQGCGYWSPSAGDAAKSDVGRPLIEVVGERLSSKPASHWLSILRCKAPEIVKPPPFALYWLVESPNVWERVQRSPQRAQLLGYYHQVLAIERGLYRWLRIGVWLTVLASVVIGWRHGRHLAGSIPALWMLAFWCVHLVFEIQGRYFLGFFLLAPMLAAWASRAIKASPISDLRLAGAVQ